MERIEERDQTARVDEEKVDANISRISLKDEKESSRNDGESVVTTRVDNISRTRIGMMLTLPSSKEPDKCLFSHLKK